MKKKILISLASVMALTGGISLIGQELNASLADTANVTTYLVLSSYGRYKGEKGQDFAAPLFIENAIKYEAAPGTSLPGKDDITTPNTAGDFDHWETYEGTGFPTVYDKVPTESGKILYAFYTNNGSTIEPPPGPGPGPTPIQGERTYYLNTGGSSLWEQAGAWFVAYCWTTELSNKWIKLTKVEDDIYTFDVNVSKYTKVIFLRMSNESSELDWSNVWNQTEDLVFGENNCYRITGWGNGKSTGMWQTYEEKN